MGPRYFSTLSVPAAIDYIRPTATFLVEAARKLRLDAASKSLFEVAVVEVLTNAVVHGSSGRPDEVVRCELEVTDAAFIVRVFDPGSGFDLAKISPPDPDRSRVEAMPETGYGLMVVRSMFPGVQTIWQGGCFGVELTLPLDTPTVSGT